MKISILAMLLAIAPACAVAADGWSFGGDLRGGFLGSESAGRDGAGDATESLRARVRGGVTREFSGPWSFAARLAGRVDSRQAGESFELDWSAPGPGGLATGQATIDTLYLDYAPAGDWRLRVGRFQAAFELEGVAKKSLDRNDSPSFDVTWTDGAWLQRRAGRWNTHVILQHNHRDGPTNTLRPPLAFDDGGSRVGVFAGVEAAAPAGPVVQRMLAVTWLPNALAPAGVGNGDRDDYLAVTAKGAAAWPFGATGRRILVAAEAGYAPSTPRRTTVGSGAGDASGFAWQASVNLMDLWPAHNVGLVHGRVADGWLVSPDFRPNERALEARWSWRVNPSWAIDARIRRREEIALPLPSLRPRTTDDLYLRATFRF